MSEMSAVVEGGQVVVDVDYPDGTELTLNIEPTADATMSKESRAALTAKLQRALEQVERGESRPLDDVVADLRARRAAR